MGIYYFFFDGFTGAAAPAVTPGGLGLLDPQEVIGLIPFRRLGVVTPDFGLRTYK